MTQITITSPWRARRRLYEPGVYSVPSDISALEARCCVTDGAGEIAKEAAPAAEPFREQDPAVKQPAPENKGRGPTPENKSPLDDSDRGGDGPKPDAGSRKRGPRAKPHGGE